MKQQKGFVLVSVLVITTITTMLAFSQINENRLQERIAGNQQKEINARLAAETGIIDAYEYIKARNMAGDSNASIESALKANTFVPTDANYSLPAQYISLNDSTFALVSLGEVYGATAYLKTSIEAIEDSGDSLFTDAVVGCDGVTVGNGLVDSYDSRLGEYGDENNNENGSLATINSNADVNLSGSGEIYGNVVSNGSISTGTGSGSEIRGDLTAANDITLRGVDTAANIHSGGDFSYKNLSATGESITVGGNITEESGNSDISSSVVYGGSNSGDFGVHSYDIVAPDTDMGECDVLAIGTVMTDLNAGGASAGATATDFSATMTAGTTLNFSESSLTSLDSGNNELANVSPVTINLPEEDVSSGTAATFDESASVYIFDAADFTAQAVNISGDITIIVQGDITTANTTFTFVDDASSLTILTSGQIDLGQNTETVNAEGTQVAIDGDGEVPVTIYSSYNSDSTGQPDEDLALTVTSNADIYAKVYAPHGNISLTGGGNIMGAVRGSNVTFNSSAGQIHYDEALADVNDTEDENTDPVSFSAVYYYYPN